MTDTDAKIMREADAWQPIEQIVADGRDVLVGCWVIDDEGETDAFWSSWTVTLNGGSLGCDGTWGGYSVALLRNSYPSRSARPHLMTDPTEIARIAAGLTRAQREAVLDEIFSLRTGVHRVRKQLVGKGLMMTSGVLAPAGETVRDHILREKSGG